jgi:hypothetical protein
VKGCRAECSSGKWQNNKFWWLLSVNTGSPLLALRDNVTTYQKYIEIQRCISTLSSYLVHAIHTFLCSLGLYKEYENRSIISALMGVSHKN